MPLARLWRVLAPLPLVFPSFIGAGAFIAGLGPDGVLRDVLELVGYHPPRRFRGLGASVLVLTLFTYPYVYLPVAARLATLPPQIEESSRLLGDRPLRTFGRVTVPLVRGAIAGGTLIVVLYCLSEFGAVQLLGYDTLTRVVYATRLADRAASFTAAALLVVMALVAIAIERRLRGPLDHRTGAATRRGRAVQLGRWKVPASAFVLIVLGLALVMPVVSLGQWAWRAVANADEPRPDALRHELDSLASPAWTTAWLGVVASVIAIAVVLPVAVLAVRRRTRISAAVTTSITAGFAVPGLVIALSLTFWALHAPGLSALYQTVPLLIVAYVVHFGAQALRSSELAVGSVPRALDESALLLGASPVRRAVTVHLPLMLPGLLAGGGLVLLSTLKELPATLLLAPIGYETLTTRVVGSVRGRPSRRGRLCRDRPRRRLDTAHVADRPAPQPPPGVSCGRQDQSRHDEDVAAAARTRASSAGALTIGQWPVAMSTNSSRFALASSGTSPASIHPCASAGVNSGHSRTTGTS